MDFDVGLYQGHDFKEMVFDACIVTLTTGFISCLFSFYCGAEGTCTIKSCLDDKYLLMCLLDTHLKMHT